MKSPTLSTILFNFCQGFVFAFPLLFLIVILVRYDLKMADDGFYYLQIAYNAAHGKGFTFDGIHLTNGFQPLWQILLVVVFWIFKSKLIVPYIVVFIQTIFYAASGVILFYLILRATHRKSMALTASFVWLCNPWFLFKGAATGMETGLFLFLWALSSLQLYRLAGYEASPNNSDDTKHCRFILLAASVLALTALSRLDAIFLVVSVAALLMFDGKMKPAVYLTGPTVIIFLMYFCVNYFYFGHIAPISGYIKSQYGKQVLIHSIHFHDTAFIRHVYDNIILFLKMDKIPPAFSVILIALLIGLFFRYKNRIQLPVRFLLATFVVNSILLVLFYASLYENVMGTYKYYWLPLLWCFIFIITILIDSTAHRIVHRSFISAAISLSLLFTFYYLKDTVKTPDFYVKPKESPLQQTIRYINQYLPENAVIGSWDAGQIGYYSNKPVINLDGLVNNYDLLKYIKADRLDDYIAKEGITYLVNCDYYKHERGWIEQRLGWTLIYNPVLLINAGHQGTRFTIQPGFNRWAAHEKIEYYIFKKP